MKPKAPVQVLGRAPLACVEVWLVFQAFKRLQLAEAYALFFTVPLWVLLFSTIFLKEKIGKRQKIALLIGFVGAIIATHPSIQGLWPGQLAGLGAAFCGGCGMIMMRHLGKTESNGTILLAFFIGQVIFNAAMMQGWHMPSTAAWTLIVIAGLAEGIAHVCLLLALQRAPAPLVAPFQYSQILWALLFGVLLFLAAPLRYNDTVRLALLPYLQQGDAVSEVAAAAARVVKNCGGRLPAFLSELTQWLYADFTRYIRLEGPPLEPAETLRRQQGSCRDLTELFNAVCRSVGLAARFVSGYHEQEDLEGRRFLHAWSEVYLPGAGWRGYDPTAGLAVADRHVAVAASTSPILAAPTCGTFRGNGADSTMETQLVIRTADRGDPVEQPLHAHFSAADAVVDSGSR